MTYITSLISGVGIFCFGTGLAWYHGVLVLLHPQEMESFYWVFKFTEVFMMELLFRFFSKGLALLSGSLISEGGSFIYFIKIDCILYNFSNTLYGC
jgi:hypothetical protein